MSTAPITEPITTRRVTAMVLTAAAALIAVAVVVASLALAGGNDRNPTINAHHHATYYPLIEYRGTGQPPGPAVGTRPTVRMPVNPRKSYGAVP